jgi:hypothetical protein
MWTARRVVCGGLLTITLSFTASSVRAQSKRQPSLGRDTWYEFLVKKCNPRDFDYGGWLERRREAFLEATVKEPHFWYSLSVTAGALMLMAAYAKLSLDHRRGIRITEEMMADIYSHDLYSRQAAKEAIEMHNQHIEKCNRAIEASEGGDARPGWGETQLDTLKAELQRVASQLEATTQERNKLQEELRQKSLVVSDLSTRLDALSKRVNAPRDSGAGEPVSTSANGDSARFVGHINRLQEELYTERQKNKRLKGG